MKDQAIVCNIGHFDNEIQVDALERLDGVKDDDQAAGRRSTTSRTGSSISCWPKAAS